MKLLIPKYQSGSSLPFGSWNPLPMGASNPMGALPNIDTDEKPTTEKKDSKVSLLSKEVINSLIKEGLPNDVTHVLNKLAAVEQSGPFSANLNRNAIYEVASLVNRALHAKESFKKALEIANTRSTLGDYAFTEQGHVIVRDGDGKISKMSIDKFRDNRELFQPLTVGEVLEVRAYDPSATFNSDLLTSVSQSVGMENISTQIKTLITGLGTFERDSTEFKTITQLNGESPSNKALAGLSELAADYNQSPNEAFVKIKSKVKSPNVEAALEYIWTVLPKNAKHQLVGSYVIEGGQETNKAAIVGEVIAKALSTYRQDSYITDMDYIKPTAESKSAKRAHRQTAAETLISGDLNQTEIKISGGAQNQVIWKLRGNTFSQLMDDNNNGVPMSPANYALLGSNKMGKYMDLSEIYFGNQKINPQQLSAMMYDGDTVGVAWLPQKSDGSIDFSQLDRLMQAYSDIDDEVDKSLAPNNIERITHTNKIFQKYGVPLQVNEKGETVPISQNMGRYFMMYAYSSHGQLGGEDNWIAFKQDGDNRKWAKKQMETVFEAYKQDDPTSMFTDIYKAPVFVKMKPFSSTDVFIFGGHGPVIPGQELEETLHRQELMKSDNSIIANSDLL